MKRFLIAVVAVLFVVGGLVWLRQHQKTSRDAAQAAAGAALVPVRVAKAVTADVPIYLDGIGTVQALNTVSIHAQVDGTLMEVRFREGQDVQAGDVLARIDPRTYQAAYDQAVGKQEQDQANLENARRDLARYEKLARTQYATAQQADTQRSTVAQLEAQVRQDQAQIDSAKTNLSFTTIKAPFAGRLGIRQVDPGNVVHAADTTPVTVLTTLKPIYVVFTLPQQTLPDVSAAMARGHPKVLVLPQNGDNTQVIDTGEAAVLDNQVDSNTGTIKLKAIFKNDALKLWPGAFVNVRLSVDVLHGVTTVPAAALQRGPAGAFLFVLDGEGQAHRRTVIVPHQDENVAVISSGLKPGDTVVTDGASRLTEGAKVKVLD
jgi:multidrug efflux system membrane fusion protein